MKSKTIGLGLIAAALLAGLVRADEVNKRPLTGLPDGPVQTAVAIVQNGNIIAIYYTTKAGVMYRVGIEQQEEIPANLALVVGNTAEYSEAIHVCEAPDRRLEKQVPKPVEVL